MSSSTREIDNSRLDTGLRRRLPIIAVAMASLAPAVARAEPGWVLIYYRQIGNVLNGDRRTMENHLFLENGSKAVNVGVTNQSNANTAIFGYTEADGHNRINPLSEGHCAYDCRIYQAGVYTDQSPMFYFQDPPNNKFYSYVTQWLYVSDRSRVTAYPTQPVYHYDLVGGLNQVNKYCKDAGFIMTEPSGTNSDAFALYNSANYQAQTFVVPANINRIISAQSFLTRGYGDPHDPFDYDASIHLGSPTGPQIGPTKSFIRHFSANFREEAVCWGINDVPVTPGQTYALKLVPRDGYEANVWATVNNNYAAGTLYNGTTQVPTHDMIAVVVGINYNSSPPHINLNPASFTRSVVRRNNLADDTFTIANGGAGTLTYTVTENVSWLSIDTTDGTSTGEADTVTISYDTASLAAGPYTGTITIAGPGADNSPRTVVVNLTVTAPPFAPCDFDLDRDVDQADFGVFQSCYSGAGVDQTDPACQGARLDLDEDVDDVDFAKFTACMSGSGVTVVTTCAD